MHGLNKKNSFSKIKFFVPLAALLSCFQNQKQTLSLSISHTSIKPSPRIIFFYPQGRGALIEVFAYQADGSRQLVAKELTNKKAYTHAIKSFQAIAETQQQIERKSYENAISTTWTFSLDNRHISVSDPGYSTQTRNLKEFVLLAQFLVHLTRLKSIDFYDEEILDE